MAPWLMGAADTKHTTDTTDTKHTTDTSAATKHTTDTKDARDNEFTEEGWCCLSPCCVVPRTPSLISLSLSLSLSLSSESSIRPLAL